MCFASFSYWEVSKVIASVDNKTARKKYSDVKRSVANHIWTHQIGATSIQQSRKLTKLLKTSKSSLNRWLLTLWRKSFWNRRETLSEKKKVFWMLAPLQHLRSQWEHQRNKKIPTSCLVHGCPWIPFSCPMRISPTLFDTQQCSLISIPYLCCQYGSHFPKSWIHRKKNILPGDNTPTSDADSFGYLLAEPIEEISTDTPYFFYPSVLKNLVPPLILHHIMSFLQQSALFVRPTFEYRCNSRQSATINTRMTIPPTCWCPL